MHQVLKPIIKYNAYLAKTIKGSYVVFILE